MRSAKTSKCYRLINLNPQCICTNNTKNKDLEKVTSDHVNKIDELLKHKEAELLEV